MPAFASSNVKFAAVSTISGYRAEVVDSVTEVFGDNAWTSGGYNHLKRW